MADDEDIDELVSESVVSIDDMIADCIVEVVEESPRKKALKSALLQKVLLEFEKNIILFVTVHGYVQQATKDDQSNTMAAVASCNAPQTPQQHHQQQQQNTPHVLPVSTPSKVESSVSYAVVP